MLRKRTFVFDPDAKRGGGWRPLDNPDFDAGGPVHVAHDVTEHFTNARQFENELLAFGATLFGRGGGREANEMAEVMASDLSGFMINEDYKVRPANPRWDKTLPERDAERHLRDVIGKAMALDFMRTFARTFGFNLGAPSNGEAYKRAEVWIRLGWRIAARRYRNQPHPHWAADQLFRNVMDAVEEDYFSDRPVKGEKLIIAADTATLKVKLERVHA